MIYTTVSGRQNIEIAQVFLHPQYDQPSSPEKSFDISLLKLKEPAQFSDYVSPPCLPDQDDFGDESSFGVGMECYLSGLNMIYLFIYSFFNFFLLIYPLFSRLGKSWTR